MKILGISLYFLERRADEILKVGCYATSGNYWWSRRGR